MLERLLGRVKGLDYRPLADPEKHCKTPVHSELPSSQIDRSVAPQARKLHAATKPSVRVDPKTIGVRCRIASSTFDKAGLGLRATVDINSGQRIMSETPFLILDHPPRPSQIRRRLDKLDMKHRNLFHSFPSTSPGASDNALVGVVVANVIPLGGAESDDERKGESRVGLDRDGMFEHLCRIIHSCVPNARWDWDANVGQMRKS